MGSKKQTQSQTTQQLMPQSQQRNVDSLMGGALNYYNSGGRQAYGGDMVADYNPYQLAGQNQILGYAGGAGQDFVDSAMAGNSFFMDPNNIMNPDNIPGYRAAQEASTRGYTENLLENILPRVRGGATSSGQFGGSASGIGQALSVDRSTQNMADSLANMDLGAYTQGLNAFNQAQNRAPSLFALGAAPGSMVEQVGAARQGQEQREIDADMERHNFQENERLQVLSALKALTGGFGEYGGTTKTDSTTKQSGGELGQALGLALMGATMMGGMPGGGGGIGKGGATTPEARPAITSGSSMLG